MHQDLIALFVDIDIRIHRLKTNVRLQSSADDKAANVQAAKALAVQVANLLSEVEKS